MVLAGLRVSRGGQSRVHLGGGLVEDYLVVDLADHDVPALVGEDWGEQPQEVEGGQLQLYSCQ